MKKLNQFNITKGFLFFNIIMFILLIICTISSYQTGKNLVELITSNYFYERFIGNILGTFCHTGLVHIISNMIAFYNLRNLEMIMGNNYLKLILLSIIFNSFFLSLFEVYAVGFSAVLFTLEIYYSKFSPIKNFMDKPMDRRIVALINIGAV